MFPQPFAAMVEKSANCDTRSGTRREFHEMAQYQTFPDAAGDSRTLEKLKSLKLPDLAGRRFLDVGCNEGFFCGYALFEGAERVVGVDYSAGFIARARRRFPRGEFLQQGWERLPEEPFDVILLASALHYAGDQPALVAALVDRLAPGGVLVLELGIASSARSEWVRVKRGIDERLFPSMPMVRDMLEAYAWKWMGPSVSQDGDPVPRHVVHISRMRPHAYLMMQPPAHGKSTIARTLFARASMPVVSGDEVILRSVRGELPVSSKLRTLLSEDHSPYRIDEAVRRTFEAGLGPDLVRAWLLEAAPGDLAVDAYVPEKWHGMVRATLAEAGYHPVTLHWQRVGVPLHSGEESTRRAEAYQAALATAPPLAFVSGEPAPYAGGPCGFVDIVQRRAGQVLVHGWAVDGDGRLPAVFSIRLAGCEHVVADAECRARPDVRKQLGLSHDACGYAFSVPVDDDTSADWLADLEVRAGDGSGVFGPPLRLAAALAGQQGLPAAGAHR
jgi:SAM-dependent methyltransferase